MWASGLPYLETGDEIEIVDRQGQTHTSYVLKRTLEGIQNLQDTYENGIVDVF
jgi:3-dehydroquinate synthase class II